MAAKYLHLYVDKANQLSNFNVRPPLAKPLQLYAIGDALLNTKLDSAIAARLFSSGINTAVHPPDLQPGTFVIIKIGGKAVAEAEIIALGELGGNRGGGESCMWGNTYVGAKKALIQLVKVLVPGVNVPFQHEDWGATRLTLDEAYVRSSPGHEIVVHSRQIHARLSASQAQGGSVATTTTGATQQSAALNSSVIRGESNSAGGDVTMTEGDAEVEEMPEEAVEAVEAADIDQDNTFIEDNDETETIRSRAKSDIWHEFYNLEKVFSSKGCPALPSVSRLCWEATTARESHDRKNVERVLSEKGITDFAKHFAFNREWWLQRVRCPPRKGEVASSNLLKVLRYLKNNHVFKEYVTSDMEKFLIGWAKRCRDGRYEDLPDVVMYEHKGFDSNGLDLWQRKRGSKAENFHQKMHVAAGPFGIGVEMSHYLHVILAYKYLISAGINRCGEPDFGHGELHLEDRIQTRILEIWGILLFPHRINVSQFRPLDFVAWGLGPLTFDPEFVEKGNPADHLGGDLHFMAKRMGVKYPPLPPFTISEFSMIKEFCHTHPGQKTVDIVNLCKKFKQLSDGKTIFPKLPSMIKPAIKRWKVNQEIQVLELQVKGSYGDIIDAFASEEVSMPPPKAPKKQSSSKRQRDSTTGEIEIDTALPVLPPPHVPPMSAPSQSQPVATTASKDTQCAWWPVCVSDARTCGGTEKSRCNVYGTNGSKCSNAPTDSEHALVVRKQIWSEKIQNQMCPWGCGSALLCGGRNKDSCEKYGKNGSDKDNRPSAEEVERMRKQRKRQQLVELRAKSANSSQSKNT